MKLLLLGATGRAGSAFLKEALERGHHVTALVRTPDKIMARHPNLAVVQGDALDLNALNAHLPGHDAVISALSPGTLKHSTLQRDFMESVTVAMINQGVERLLVLSVAFLFNDAGRLTRVLGKTLFRNIKSGSQAMEEVVKRSGLAWTIIRLPRLTADLRAAKYHARVGQAPRARSISRGTLAGFVLTEVEHNQFVHSVVGVSAQEREMTAPRSTASKLLGALRSVLAIHLLTVVFLGALAGMFLSGNDTAVALHEIASRVLVVVCLVQIALTVLLRARHACPAWMLPSAIGILIAELVEIYAGYQRILILHVPLAILIFGGIMRHLFWAVGTARASEETTT